MIFFADENFQRPGAELLKVFDAEHQIIHLLDKFPKGTEDVDWLAAIGKWQPKPIIVSGDGVILSNAVERAALKATGCVYVFLAPGWTNMAWPQFAWKLIKCWPDVVQEVQKVRAGTILQISTQGHVRLR